MQKPEAGLPAESSGHPNVLHDVTIAFIGAGAMGEAMMRGLLNSRLVPPGALVASDPREGRAEELRALHGVRAVEKNRDAVRDAQIVILSVKPQVLRAVFRDLRGAIPRGALVLSIVAGARVESITRGLRHAAVVRSMPNTPAQVGQGMTVWTATRDVTPVQSRQAQVILQALGQELYVADEAYLDMATAISGTGPAYVFLFIEALIDAAVHLGFSRAEARTLVVQTAKGSAIFAEQSSAHPAEMRDLVTSPGGTTAHALYQLEKGGFRTALSKAVWAAYQRSVSLAALTGAAQPLEDEDTAGADA